MDSLLNAADSALRTLFARPAATRPSPAAQITNAAPLAPVEQREAAALMRVNHVGEVCAQALYTAQAFATRDPRMRQRFEAAAREETDHLAWTRERLDQLGGRPSLLNPVWYAGAFGLGLLAGRFGDRLSLGFVVETERQVEAHLESHLGRLPPGDLASRAIVEQMKTDEGAHAADALNAGGTPLPAAVRRMMNAAARVMTTTAHYI